MMYMVLHPIRCTALIVANKTGGLLPHLFTLAYPERLGGFFLLHYYTLADIFLLGSMVLFGARTFLFAVSEAVEQSAVIFNNTDKLTNCYNGD
jgi:hypothetical protein